MTVPIIKINRIGTGSELFFKQEGFNGKKTVKQKNQRDQTIGKGPFGHCHTQKIGAYPAEQGPKEKETDPFKQRNMGAETKVVPLLLELPSPTQNIIGLTQPRNQALVFNHACIAIHTLGISIAIRKTAIQAELVILPLI